MQLCISPRSLTVPALLPKCLHLMSMWRVPADDDICTVYIGSGSVFCHGIKLKVDGITHEQHWFLVDKTSHVDHKITAAETFTI